jgi:integrase
LLLPVREALGAISANLPSHFGVCRILLAEMFERQRSFWEWRPEEWTEILCGSASAFENRYPGLAPSRHQVLAVAYLLCNFTDFHTLGAFRRNQFADTIFGKERMEGTLERIIEGAKRWGLSHQHTQTVKSALQEALLVNHSPHLEDLTIELLVTMSERTKSLTLKKGLRRVSCALIALGIFHTILPEVSHPDTKKAEKRQSWQSLGVGTIASEWLSICQRWRATSTLTASTRQTHYTFLLKTGRWLVKEHPEYSNPDSWTREFVATFVAFVDQQRAGDWIESEYVNRLIKDKVGQPVGAGYKKHFLAALRAFFLDCQEWGWIHPRFDPRRALATPRSIRALIGPNPRTISDDIWAKLLWASLHLTREDLPVRYQPVEGQPPIVWYPLEMVRAMTIVWLFCGLRSDEWSRLRLGCVRWQREDVTIAGTNEVLPKESVCLMDIPTHKTGTAFTKPVDRVVGEAIAAWEQVRPPQPAMRDPKTGEVVHFLFTYRGERVGKPYLNKVLIATLCQKAGVPRQDARGNITSHRARSTIASQLFNAAEPLSLFELQEWLGHRSISSTQHYAKLSPTRLTRSVVKAAYFERNLRLIDGLIDQEAIKSGAATSGQPWRYYDLGHGLCTYDFFDTCPHQMACAKCSFSVPKGSSLEQILEGKVNLLRMKQELSLTEEEVTAVDDGLTALATLQQKLADVPTPAGPTPRQLEESPPPPSLISVQSVRSKQSKK